MEGRGTMLTILTDFVWYSRTMPLCQSGGMPLCVFGTKSIVPDRRDAMLCRAMQCRATPCRYHACRLPSNFVEGTIGFHRQ
jgi:hypothetical protein